MPLRGPFKKVFIRAPNWVGDCVAATAVFREIRTSYPDSDLVIGVREKLEPILRGAPWASKLLFVESSNGDSGGAGVWDVAKKLKQENFDLALILPNSFRSALPSFLAGIPHRVGYSGGGRSPLLTRRLSPNRTGWKRVPVPMVYSYSNLAGLIGVTPRSIRPELFYEESVRKEAESFLEPRGIRPGEKYAVISPGASYGSSKLWRAESFSALIDAIFEKLGLKSFIHCGPGEEKIGEEIVRLCKSKPASGHDSPRDLHQLKPIVHGSSVLICTDSGPRHYGVAFDRPVVCLMGPNHPMYTHANVEKTEVVRVEVDCGPCQLKVCPLDHRCMERISPEMVFEAVQRAIKK